MSSERKVIRGIKAAIFDLDGTLFDSTWLWKRVDVEFLQKRGFEPTPEYKRAIAALGNREGAIFTVNYYGLKDTPEELMAEWADMARYYYTNEIELFPGVRDYLEACAAEGIKLFVATSLARELAEPCLIHNGIMPLFSDMFTADDTGLSKTSPAIFEHIIAEAGCNAAECVMFDDVAVALRSARAAGLTTVAITGDGSYSAYTEISGGDADYIVTSLSEAPVLKRS